MKLIRSLNKPEYFFQPFQLIRRVLRGPIERGDPGVRSKAVRLPSSLRKIKINARVGDDIGNALWHLGVYDLAVTECIMRLIDSGETVVDAGANIGYMSAVMATATGPRGVVHSFEPHPALFQVLSSHAKDWSFQGLKLHWTALSDQAGKTKLTIPVDFELNTGTAYISGDGEALKSSATQIEIETETLDGLFQSSPPRFIKMDIEGHELRAFKGAMNLLRSGSVRDIVFEDHGKAPSPVMNFLEKFGYKIFAIEKRFWGPHLADPSLAQSNDWEPRSFLATLSSERARQRMRAHGWRTFRSIGSSTS